MATLLLIFWTGIITVFGYLRIACAEEINIEAIIQIESSGNPFAVSEDGCVGLMQLSQSVIDEFNKRYSKPKLYYKKEELFDYCNNVKIGTWYINQRIPEMLKAYHIPDTISTRLIAYNWGIGNLVKFNKKYAGHAVQDTLKYLPEETRGYLKKYYKLIKEDK
jgi:soluble lytic murein transglycosylase-like protein